jgi:hypothetical protein
MEFYKTLMCNYFFISKGISPAKFKKVGLSDLQNKV